MTSLAEQLREFIDTLNEYGPTKFDKDHVGRTRFKTKGHIVPGSPEGIIAEHILAFADDMVIQMDKMQKLEEEQKQRVMVKLQELVEFAQNEL